MSTIPSVTVNKGSILRKLAADDRSLSRSKGGVTRSDHIANEHERRHEMSEPKEPSVAQKLVGDFAPKLAQLTDDVLFGDVWERAELSPRDRSLVTVAALIANGNTEQLAGHLSRAKQNGLSETELAEVIIHLAFYAGWPRAMSGSVPSSRRATAALSLSPR